MGWINVGAAALLACASLASAQLPGPTKQAGLSVTANSKPLCQANILELPASVWGATCTNGRVILQPSSNVSLLGACIGDDPTKFCPTVDFTGRSLQAGAATDVTPWRTGTTPPGTCTVGNAFFDTDAPWGADIYACTAPNVWVSPRLYRLTGRREWRLQQRDQIGAAPAIDAVGIDGTVNTVTTSGTADLVDATGEYIAYTSAAVSGNQAAWSSARFTLTRTDQAPQLLAVIHTGADIANIRLHVGLISAASLGNANIHAALVRYDTGLDGTAFFRCVTNNGGTFPGTVTTSSIPILANTRYTIQVIAETPTTIRFLINDALACTHTATTPTSTQSLGYVVGLQTLAAAAKTLAISNIQLSHE